jgi:hypothetical protein
MTREFSRRRFLKTIGGATAAASFPDVLRVVASQPTQENVVRPRAIVFWETDFPQIDGCSLDRNLLQTALERFEVRYLSEPELIEQLKHDRCDLLVTPYGSAFPKRAWPAMLAYLRAGGNLLNLGGAPFSVPVTRAGSQWQMESRQTAYHKKLGITQSFPVDSEAIASYRPANHFHAENPNDNDQQQLAKDFKAEKVYELYVRFTSSNSVPDESGSDGPREAVLHPLVFGVNRDQRPVAAPVIQIDRLQGEFAGGRWVLANCSGRISAAAVAQLANLAVQGATEFRARSEFACYRSGETPQIVIEVNRSNGNLEKLIKGDGRVRVRTGAGRVISQWMIALKAEGKQASGSTKLRDLTTLAPGFYHVDAWLTMVNGNSTREIFYTTGFWVFDQKLLSSGKPLTVDENSFYREGQPFPATGTTYMASDVHRQFLFEPNPFVWDEDFRAMKAAGVNLVRTGIWTGWKQLMSADGKMNEAALRALDAFLLTAHQYDIPVIFTLFAFLPETWGGKNAYLDPRSLRAQSRFVGALAERYREVDDLIWDLINEPSFCSPKHLWSCRPNYDEHEKAAWKGWLTQRYQYPDDETRTAALQQLWRTTDESPFDLPRLEDFDSPNILNDRRPLKTLDYRLFAQEVFRLWVVLMKVAMINRNPKQLITVGQDEGGLGESPSPHFFADAVDFTCMHNWWANDDLVWDSVMAKTPGKASLIEETGIMFYEKTDGSAWRTEEEARNLLERKLAISFAAQGAGFVEWIWNANCYMNSDNEAAIGFYRADGTAKPELDSFLKITKFIQAHRDALRSRQDESVLMLIPHSQMFAPRSFATETTRKCVRAMFYQCRVPLRTVSEYALAESKANAKLIIVPSPRVLTEKCWRSLVDHAARGATVAISGVLDADEHWMSVAARYSEVFGITADSESVSESEPIMIGRREYLVRYEGEKIQRIEKAVLKTPGPARVSVKSHGAGRFVWSPLPLEAGNSTEALVAFYRFALAQASIAPAFTVSPDDPSILVLPSVFAQQVLYTFVSETDRDATITLGRPGTNGTRSVNIPAGRTTFVLVDRQSGKLIDSTALR